MLNVILGLLFTALYVLQFYLCVRVMRGYFYFLISNFKLQTPALTLPETQAPTLPNQHPSSSAHVQAPE